MAEINGESGGVALKYGDRLKISERNGGAGMKRSCISSANYEKLSSQYPAAKCSWLWRQHENSASANQYLAAGSWHGWHRRESMAAAALAGEEAKMAKWR
jgi:hypothetical protein